MALEPVQLRTFAEPDREAVQADAIAAVQTDHESFLARYAAMPDSFDGRYVCADLFKETFPAYAASPFARGRYNNAVHNAAAVLSAEQFRRVLADDSDPERIKAVFLTGIPGAGKTSAVLAGGDLPRDYRVVFEGQLIRPETSLPKIQQAIDAGLEPVIIAVHALPENALQNTFKRFSEVGRGASIGVMADIQGGLPDGLEQIRLHFGHIARLSIWDHRNRIDPRVHHGWDNIDLLRSEGNREQVHQRLKGALDRSAGAGRITENCYRQALGLAPVENGAGLDRPRASGRQADGDGRDLPPANRTSAVLIDAGRIERPEAGRRYIGRVVSITDTTAVQALKNGRHVAHDLAKITAAGGDLVKPGARLKIAYSAEGGGVTVATAPARTIDQGR